MTLCRLFGVPPSVILREDAYLLLQTVALVELGRED